MRRSKSNENKLSNCYELKITSSYENEWDHNICIRGEVYRGNKLVAEVIEDSLEGWYFGNECSKYEFKRFLKTVFYHMKGNKKSTNLSDSYIKMLVFHEGIKLLIYNL